jgi:hypothetical protein
MNSQKSRQFSAPLGARLAHFERLLHETPPQTKEFSIWIIHRNGVSEDK